MKQFEVMLNEAHEPDFAQAYVVAGCDAEDAAVQYAHDCVNSDPGFTPEVAWVRDEDGVVHRFELDVAYELTISARAAS